MSRSCTTTVARRTRATTTLVVSFGLFILLCPFLFLLTAEASASSTAPSLDATCTGSTASRTAGAPLAPVIAGWFQSSASAKHHKAEKKRQLLKQQLEQQQQQQRQDSDDKGAESVTVAFIQSGKERGLGVVRVFASTLRASLIPLVQGVVTLLSFVARAVEWWLVKAPGAAVGRVGKEFGKVSMRGKRERGKSGRGEEKERMLLYLSDLLVGFLLVWHVFVRMVLCTVKWRR